MHTDAPRQGDPIWIDWSNACVRCQGAAVRLTPKAWAVLGALTARAGQLVPKAALLEAVWPDAAVGEAVLTECIRELRKAFGETARAPRWIRTVHRRGYLFLGPVPGPGPGPGWGGAAVPAPPPQPGAPAFPTRASGAAAFVGRAAEMTQLHARLAQARRGARQVVFVTGEPGIGKTTLVQAFVEQIEAAGEVWIAQGQCLDHYGAGEAYLPVLEALGRLCRAPGGAACLAVLEQQAPTWLVQLPALLSCPAFEAVQRRALGATQARMLREMADALDALTQEHPLVLILEDLHWSDAATLDLLAALARRPDPARLMVLGTYRPVDVIVHQHPLKVLKQELEIHRQCTELPLELLSAAEVAQYLAVHFATGVPRVVPLEVLARMLHQRTDGHPLFLVTMVDDLMREGLVREVAGQWIVEAGSAAALRGMPANLRRMLIQQYDELATADQQVVDAASVAGMRWSAAAVAAGLEVAVEAVEVRCAALARRGQWLEAHGLEAWPDGTVAECYGWRHTLAQEVVYEHVSAGQRLRLHRRIGLRLEAAYGEQASVHAIVLADHFVRGHEAPRAVAYLHQAAQQALRRYAYPEAVNHLTQGLALLQPLPTTPERRQQELAMQATLGVALMPLQGYSAPDVERAYTRARALAQQVGETPQTFLVLWGLWAYYFVQGALLTAHELGEHLLALAQRTSDPALRLEAHLALGANEQHLGEMVTARAHLEQALALFDPHQHRAHAWCYGQDPQVIALADLACVLWMLGYPDQAWQRSYEALTVAETVDHIYSQGLVHFFAAWVAQLCRNPQATAAQAAALLTLAHEHAFAYLAAMGMLLQGWAIAMQGQAAAGLAQMREGLAAYQAIIGGVSMPHFLASLAEAYGQAGQIAESLALLAEALSVVHHTGDRWWEAELYRLQGEFLLMQSTDHAAEAAACFHQALALAHHQQAKSLELRAAMSLARLLQRQGMRAEAHALLAPIYGWFTEGFDMADLQDAAVLLDELGEKHGQAPCVETLPPTENKGWSELLGGGKQYPPESRAS